MCYKYGYKIEDVLDLTLPQLNILSKNLNKICKAEAGKSDDVDIPNSNSNSNDTGNGENKWIIQRKAFGNAIRLLKERTGRKSFTQEEILNPERTIKKYGDLKHGNNNNITTS